MTNGAPAVIIDRVNIDDDLNALREKNEYYRTRKLKALQAAEKDYNAKQSKIHSHTYQKQDAAIKEYASLPGRRAPGTYVYSRQRGLKVFCINCGEGTIYNPPKVSPSGRLLNRKRCKCGECTNVILKGFQK